MRTLLWPGDRPINTNMSVRTRVWCKQTRTRNNSWLRGPSVTLCLVPDRDTQVWQIWPPRTWGGVFTSASGPIWPTLRCFKSFVQSTVVQPSQIQCSVFFFPLYRNSPLSKTNTQNTNCRRIQKEGVLTDVCTSFNSPPCSQHFDKWHDSLLRPLPVHYAPTTFLNQQVMSGCSSLPSVRSPILRC